MEFPREENLTIVFLVDFIVAPYVCVDCDTWGDKKQLVMSSAGDSEGEEGGRSSLLLLCFK